MEVSLSGSKKFLTSCVNLLSRKSVYYGFVCLFQYSKNQQDALLIFTSIYQPTNAHIIPHKTLLKHVKTLRHVSILSNHHQGALFLAKIILQYSQFNSYLQTRCCGSISCVGMCCVTVARCASYRSVLKCFKSALKVFYGKLYVHSLVDKLKWFYENARCYNTIYTYIQFISVINLYIFPAGFLLIIRKYYAVYTATGIRHGFMLSGCWQDRNGKVPFGSCQQHTHTNCCIYRVVSPDDEQ